MRCRERGRESIASAVRQGAHAVYVVSDLFLQGQRQHIVALALRHKLPVVSTSREAVRAGQLISYGADDLEMYRRAGIYVGRILKGDNPANLPVQQASKVELYINFKTAKALGITVPLPLSGRADEVFE
jgi:putative tryptophan/tyrosine transport system substrate-binding protein